MRMASTLVPRIPPPSPASRSPSAAVRLPCAQGAPARPVSAEFLAAALMLAVAVERATWRVMTPSIPEVMSADMA